ncbi:oxygen-dependent protoporphyrinogen oxidase [Dysgonomonas sp. PFB1-18]|uniref:protoporphyrinogen/coproporphyrinogen oxidase n=1 Tax=unclassified Dysgonomonas TaxID=2630389 RepID=UPI002473FCBC|nr:MULTISPECIES: FAD-dependent oxidoreductase [unclassified Dysgonomonas]MDH6308777.1 oxygen-dependent protoporphyrinogen oxidase [Dysgonomonas sp. PF1-14]MDH6338526.1 oxygen-dependent protoporphyrinogen oxidase [Dysgonomonas sp. PF1-16]MDH6380026.1 oxygen-dependent protoporphyrinogen oxidase [Dysgonomonas sp. PFB1-18]MDH6397354.1 oxygen-dependent protoporphyrinogen oxidase [Dysgonomonas sp. PF1-23]
MTETIYDCVIAGAGISGISFAHYLHTVGAKTLLLEQNERVGGQIQTATTESNPMYWRELGSHTCYNSYTHLLSIVKEIGADDSVLPLKKQSYVLYDNKIKSLFAGISLFPFIFSIPKMFLADKTGKTVREYFRPIFGKTNYDKLFRHAFRAVICQPADNYPAEMFLKRRKGRFEEFPRKYSYKNGLNTLITDIINKDGLEVKTGSKVELIEKQNDIFVIKTTGGVVYKAKNVALATNPQITAELLKNTEPLLSELLATIPVFRSESVNITIPKDKLALKEVAGVISLSDEFMSAVSRDMVEDDTLRSFTFHFEKGKKSEQEKLDLICKVLGISAQDIMETVATNHELASTGIQHLHLNNQVEEKRQDSNIYILGNYYYGLSIEDCVNRSKDEFERWKKNY